MEDVKILDKMIICDDCLRVLPTLNPANAVICDPPYGMNYLNTWGDKKFAKIINDHAPFLDWIEPAANCIIDGGCMIVFCRWDSWNVFHNAVESSGLTVKGQIVWDKLEHSAGDLKGAPGNRHEIAIFATKGGFKFHGMRPQTVGAFKRLRWVEHPTEKPVALMEWLVEHYCPPGGTVIDPCAGISPIGVACANLGRNYIGIEIDENYAKIGNERIRNAKAQSRMFA